MDVTTLYGIHPLPPHIPTLHPQDSGQVMSC